MILLILCVFVLRCRGEFPLDLPNVEPLCSLYFSLYSLCGKKEPRTQSFFQDAVIGDSKTGLWYDELKKMLKPLIQSPYFTGMEITILDPTFDKEGKYINQFVKEMAEIFKS